MKNTMIAILLALLALAGCRQKDVREFTVEVPALTQTNEVAVTTAIRSALAGCCGIDMGSLEFDSANHCLRLRYDSMQTAKKNIEMAIAKIGYVANGVKPEEMDSVKPAAR